jgi:hypothetical protein
MRVALFMNGSAAIASSEERSMWAAGRGAVMLLVLMSAGCFFPAAGYFVDLKAPQNSVAGQDVLQEMKREASRFGFVPVGDQEERLKVGHRVIECCYTRRSLPEREDDIFACVTVPATGEKDGTINVRLLTAGYGRDPAVKAEVEAIAEAFRKKLEWIFGSGRVSVEKGPWAV